MVLVGLATKHAPKLCLPTGYLQSISCSKSISVSRSVPWGIYYLQVLYRAFSRMGACTVTAVHRLSQLSHAIANSFVGAIVPGYIARHAHKPGYGALASVRCVWPALLAAIALKPVHYVRAHTPTHTDTIHTSIDTHARARARALSLSLSLSHSLSLSLTLSHALALALALAHMDTIHWL